MPKPTTSEHTGDTFLHPTTTGLSETLILRQIEDQKRAEREEVLENTSIDQILRAE